MELSVIIPCYNCEKSLIRALDSINQQDEFDVEIILVDDGSTDNTFSIAQQYQQHSRFPIRLHRQSNQGPGAARNFGMDIAQGDYLVFLDADDAFKKEALSHFKNAFKNNPAIDMVIAGQRKMSLKPHEKLKAYLLGNFSINMGSVAIKRLSAQTIRFPTHVRNNEDTVFYSYCLCLLKCMCIHDITVTIHHHSDSQRHQYADILLSGEQIPDLIFDRKDLPAEVYALKKPYQAHKLISLAKVALKLQKKLEAKRLVFRSIQLDPKIFFKIRTLKTLLKLTIPSAP